MTAEILASGASEAGTVLVTGATGYVGGHMVARLLREGYRTRVTVREPGREAEVLALVRQAGVDREDLLECAVADLSADAGWAAAADGVSHVLHVASPFPSRRRRTRTNSSSRHVTARCGSSPRPGPPAYDVW